MNKNNIEFNFKRIQEIINETAIKQNRDPSRIKLIVVTKSQPIEKIIEVITAGAKFIGENYPEETLQKFENNSEILNSVELHMIGHLQSRKSKLVVDRFNCLHSLDSLKLANRLNKQLSEVDKSLDVLLQFNVAGESSKFGWDASDRIKWNFLVDEVKQIKNNCPNLKITGLMTMPPIAENEIDSRKNFQKLVNLGNYFQDKIPGLRILEYSMGTTHDFTYAIVEGATMVRIGTAIMGPREGKEV